MDESGWVEEHPMGGERTDGMGVGGVTRKGNIMRCKLME